MCTSIIRVKFKSVINDPAFVPVDSDEELAAKEKEYTENEEVVSYSVYHLTRRYERSSIMTETFNLEKAK